MIREICGTDGERVTVRCALCEEWSEQAASDSALQVHKEHLEDKHPRGSWTHVAPLRLDGFTYGRFDEEPQWKARYRKEWLGRTEVFERGSWQQLIAVYRAEGRSGDANYAGVAMENDRVKRIQPRPPRNQLGGRYFLRAFIGHGYRPWRAAIWALGIILVYGILVGQRPEMFVYTKKPMPRQPTMDSVQAFAYAADTFLPVVDLGQAGDWKPTGWARYLDWTVILLGWALTTLFVAGFTRIVRNE